MKARTFVAPLLAAVFLVSLLAQGAPTPGNHGAEGELATGRLFQEPLQSNDYIGYYETDVILDILNDRRPDLIEVFRLPESYGWVNQQNGLREPQPLYLVEVTNESSPIPFDEKMQLLFMCSIHGNEKGGREGCMRVIEDFAKNIDFVSERGDLLGLLDYMTLIFIVPNSDGWTHDEPQYYTGNPSTMMTRQNANGTDLNRQWPTMGRMEIDQSHKTLAEPESYAAATFMQLRYKNVHYASDIHGMLNPADLYTPPERPQECDPNDPSAQQACQEYSGEAQQWFEAENKGHFLLSLLPAGQLSQKEQVRMTGLSELLRERFDQCAGDLAPAWCASPSVGAWGGNFNHWGTVWETIGYQVSGGSHDWMLSDKGLDAPAVSFEMAYNHIACDGVYGGCGHITNEFHVSIVRIIVATFMDAAKQDLQVSIETNGNPTGYLFNPLVVTNLDENGSNMPAGGWSDENSRDDLWDSLHNTYQSTPNAYLRDFSYYVAEGDRPGVFEEVPVGEISPTRLASYSSFVIAGSAYNELRDNHKTMLQQWVENGGNLALTDEAVQLVADFGLVPEDRVGVIIQYVGYTEVLDAEHPLAKDLVGYSRQTYEPVPVGIAQGSSPIWYVDTTALKEAGGTPVGVVAPGTGRLDESNFTNLAEVPMGDGTIRFLGALVPDPTYENYAPYGVADYAVTYAGNQYFINLLGYDQKFTAPPLILDEPGNLRKINEPGPPEPVAMGNNSTEAADDSGGFTPGLGAPLSALGILAAALVIARRRR